MGSLSVFVDAGYLFKQGSGAVLKAKLGRHEIALDAHKFIDALVAWGCERYPKDELLRTYWYDGARHGVPTPDQLHVAALPFVKLRLGRINSSGQQKGVDTLIVRDLMVLSQERSIQRAIVLSGDEDLREGIDYAQDRGVRVAVVGIDANGDRSQSVELVREADESLVLPTTILDGILTRKELPPRSTEVRIAPVSPLVSPESADEVRFVTCAKEFARHWLEQTTSSEVAAIVADRPRIPRDLDALILQHAVRATGVFTIADEPRRAMRAAFWAEINQVAPPTGQPAGGVGSGGAADTEKSS
ncbi:MAG: NYN domain-containing protein [Acidimicrobiales bacterium]